MKRNLSVLKNMAWAVAILACLVALFVALLIAAFTPYSGPIERGGVLLGEDRKEAAAGTPVEAEIQTGGELRTLAETTDAGQGYIDGLTFLCDSSVIGLRDYALLSGGTATTQVWGSTAGNLPAGSLAESRILYPDDGSELSPAQAAAKAQPARLVMVLGTDGLAGIDETSFVEGYTNLIRSIQMASPNTTIIVCSVSSVTTSYAGADGVDANTMKAVNEWIRTVCTDTGVYYADTGSAVNDSAGWLDPDYASANGKALNSAGIRQVLDYLRTHAV